MMSEDNITDYVEKELVTQMWIQLYLFVDLKLEKFWKFLDKKERR